MISVSIKGLDGLRKLADGLRDTNRALAAASKAGCEQTLNLIAKGFKAGTDPYGQAWDAPNNLQITGGIRSYARKRQDADGWTVHSTDEKAIWHHAPQPRAAWGGRKLPTRLQVPINGRMPPLWAQAIARVCGKALRLAISRTR